MKKHCVTEVPSENEGPLGGLVFDAFSVTLAAILAALGRGEMFRYTGLRVEADAFAAVGPVPRIPEAWTFAESFNPNRIAIFSWTIDT